MLCLRTGSGISLATLAVHICLAAVGDAGVVFPICVSPQCRDWIGPTVVARDFLVSLIFTYSFFPLQTCSYWTPQLCSSLSLLYAVWKLVQGGWGGWAAQRKSVTWGRRQRWSLLANAAPPHFQNLKSSPPFAIPQPWTFPMFISMATFCVIFILALLALLEVHQLTRIGFKEPTFVFISFLLWFFFPISLDSCLVLFSACRLQRCWFFFSLRML